MVKRKQRTVYIAYLDSVPFMHPRKFRTGAYQEVLGAYIAHVKARAFSKVYIWACPPKRHSPFILNSHPTWQRYPSTDRLKRWYGSIVQQCVDEKSVISCQSLQEEHFAGFKPFVATRRSARSSPITSDAESDFSESGRMIGYGSNGQLRFGNGAFRNLQKLETHQKKKKRFRVVYKGNQKDDGKDGKRRRLNDNSRSSNLSTKHLETDKKDSEMDSVETILERVSTSLMSRKRQPSPPTMKEDSFAQLSPTSGKTARLFAKTANCMALVLAASTASSEAASLCNSAVPSPRKRPPMPFIGWKPTKRNGAVRRTTELLLPYFNGDFWVDAAEDILTDLEEAPPKGHRDDDRALRHWWLTVQGLQRTRQWRLRREWIEKTQQDLPLPDVFSPKKISNAVYPTRLKPNLSHTIKNQKKQKGWVIETIANSPERRGDVSGARMGPLFLEPVVVADTESASHYLDQGKLSMPAASIDNKRIIEEAFGDAPYEVSGDTAGASSWYRGGLTRRSWLMRRLAAKVRPMKDQFFVLRLWQHCSRCDNALSFCMAWCCDGGNHGDCDFCLCDSCYNLMHEDAAARAVAEAAEAAAIVAEKERIIAARHAEHERLAKAQDDALTVANSHAELLRERISEVMKMRAEGELMKLEDTRDTAMESDFDTDDMDFNDSDKETEKAWEWLQNSTAKEGRKQQKKKYEQDIAFATKKFDDIIKRRTPPLSVIDVDDELEELHKSVEFPNSPSFQGKNKNAPSIKLKLVRSNTMAVGSTKNKNFSFQKGPSLKRSNTAPSLRRPSTATTGKPDFWCPFANNKDKENEATYGHRLVPRRQYFVPSGVEESRAKRKEEGESGIPGTIGRYVGEKYRFSTCMNRRLGFLSMCQKQHFQFDELRRAQHASANIILRLHEDLCPERVKAVIADMRLERKE
eukprot:g4993.t1